MDREIIKSLARKYFENHSQVSIDLEVLTAQKYTMSAIDLEKIFKNISDNLYFFESRLNYPLQLSNLYFFVFDALYIQKDKWRGSQKRHRITEEYLNNYIKDLLQ